MLIIPHLTTIRENEMMGATSPTGPLEEAVILAEGGDTHHLAVSATRRRGMRRPSLNDEHDLRRAGKELADPWSGHMECGIQ